MEKNMYHPDLKEYSQLKGHGKLVPVYGEIDAGGETPVSALLKIKRGDYAFLLESVEGSQAGFSFIGTEPYRVLSTREKDGVNPLSPLAAELAKHRLVEIDGLPDFCGGAVGYLGYETVRRLEELPSPDSDPLSLPEALFKLQHPLRSGERVDAVVQVGDSLLPVDAKFPL